MDGLRIHVGATPMLVVFATFLLSVVAATEPDVSVESFQSADAAVWTADDVRVWAAQASIEAGLLEGEQTALGCELDRKDTAACKQVGLIQAVLRDLAVDRRDASAADALEAFYRIIALEKQLALLAQSDEILASLLKMATRAEELELPDGDSSELQQQRLVVRNQQSMARAGIRKLKRQLATRVGRPLADAEHAKLVASKLTGKMPLDELQAVDVALQNRGDYRASETLCRCMTVDSLPAAKSMMGVLQPGLGLAAVASSPASFLLRIHAPEPKVPDLACRRRQCQNLRESSREAIVEQVALAIIDVEMANERLQIASEVQQLAIAKTALKRSAERIDKVAPGAERLARLEQLKHQADEIDRERDAAIADVQLRRAAGVLAIPIQLNE